MDEMKEKLKMIILKKYESEADCASAMGWTRQRLNKIVNAVKEPDITEVEAIAIAVNVPISELAPIFLIHWSPNRQRAV